MEDDATVMYPVPDQAERTFERIIGNSATLESVLEQGEQVAPTDSTVSADCYLCAQRVMVGAAWPPYLGS